MDERKRRKYWTHGPPKSKEKKTTISEAEREKRKENPTPFLGLLTDHWLLTDQVFFYWMKKKERIRRRR